MELIPKRAPNASMNWTMQGEFSIRQKTASDPTYLHVKLMVENNKDLNGDYSYLPDDCVVQTFLQIRNKAQTDALGVDYFENVVASFDYVPADLGEVPDGRLRTSFSCGP